MSASRALGRMALRNVARNWRHSVAVMLSIAVGFAAIGVSEGYIADLRRMQLEGVSRANMFGDLLVERRGAHEPAAREDPLRFSLDPDDQAFVESFLREHADAVRSRVRFLFMRGLASTGRAGVMAGGFGYDVQEGATMRREWAWNTVAGRPLQVAPPVAALVGRGLGSALDCVPTTDAPFMGADGKPIPGERPFRCRKDRVQFSATTESGQLNVVEPAVSGIVDGMLKAVDERLVVMPLPMVQKLLDTPKVSMISVELADSSGADAFAREFDAAARTAGRDLTMRSWQEHPTGEMVRRGLALLSIYRSFVVLVVTFIVGMAVLTTMMKTVNERIREIGTLRSLGFLRRHLLSLFAMEAALLATASALVGLAGTLALTAAVNHAGITYRAGILSSSIPFTLAVVPQTYGAALAFLCSLAMAAAILPVRRALDRGIPAALGHV